MILYCTLRKIRHHALLDNADFNAVAAKARIAHLSGDCNVFGDAVSRALWPRFFSLCRAISIRPVQLAPPPALLDIIERLVAFGRARGQEIRD